MNSRNRLNHGLLAVLTALGLSAAPTIAEACSCISAQPFEEVARQMPFAVVGRVIAVGPNLNRDDWEPAHPLFLDIAIEWVGKGPLTAKTARVWTTQEWISCNEGFRGRAVGDLVALTFQRVDRNRGFLMPGEYRGFERREGDFEQRFACGVSTVYLATATDRARYVGKPIP